MKFLVSQDEYEPWLIAVNRLYTASLSTLLISSNTYKLLLEYDGNNWRLT